MEKNDLRVDAYIQKAAPFAQPILTHLRHLVHQACPEATETIKWGFPHFEYKGILCSMAAFKNHCAFGFWKAPLLADPQKLFKEKTGPAMGQLGQLKSLINLPADNVLLAYIKAAAELNEKEVKLTVKLKKTERPALEVPSYFLEALGTNQDAQQTFEKFSYSYQKEYVTWITEAKTKATRSNRIATALEWLAAGKSRNWKYERK